MPLSHRPGHAQVDFGETLGVIGGVECKIHFYVMSLLHSDAVFVKGYPAETTEAFCDDHVSAFASAAALYRASQALIAVTLGSTFGTASGALYAANTIEFSRILDIRIAAFTLSFAIPA